MAATEWVEVDRMWCERAGSTAKLLEKRVYPSEFLPDTTGYRVLARKCSCDVECNLAQFPCKWAFTRPEFDPFKLI